MRSSQEMRLTNDSRQTFTHSINKTETEDSKNKTLNEKKLFRIPVPKEKKFLFDVQESQEHKLNEAPPFTVNPHKVIFRDYDTEKFYETKVIVTNTCSQPNTFRLQPIPAMLSGYFFVQFSPPGTLSAGMTCEVIVKFRAPISFDRDITNGTITFIAEIGGEFFLHVGCQTRKCIPRLIMVTGNGIKGLKFDRYEHNKNPEDEGQQNFVGVLRKSNWFVEVDFGISNFGDCVSRSIEIFNYGSLDTDFEATFFTTLTSEQIENQISLETEIKIEKPEDSEKKNFRDSIPKNELINSSEDLKCTHYFNFTRNKS
ncbi:hypothetical protein HK096_010507, partial [Nowakowskiella sp. JEL0078]